MRQNIPVDGAQSTILDHWRKKLPQKKITAILDIFADLSVTKSERKQLHDLITTKQLLVGARSLLSSLSLSDKIDAIVGHYGHRLREQHMLAILKKSFTTRDSNKQSAGLIRLRQLDPRHEVGLIAPLMKICRDPEIAPEVAFLAFALALKIRKGLSNNKHTRLLAPSDYIRAVAFSPSLQKSAKYMLFCTKKSSICAKFAHPSLLFFNSAFLKKVVDEENILDLIGFVSKMNPVDLTDIFEKVIYRNLRLLKSLGPIIRQIDPIALFIMASDILADNADTLPEVFPLLHRVNASFAVKRALVAARKSITAFEYLAPRLDNTYREKIHQMALSLLHEDPHDIKRIAPYLEGAAPRIKQRLKRLVRHNPDMVPFVTKLFDDSELEAIIFRALRKGAFRIENGFGDIPYRALVPLLDRWEKGKNKKLRELSAAVTRSFIASRSRAISVYLLKMKRYSRRREALQIARDNAAPYFPYMDYIPMPLRSAREIQEAAFKSNFLEIAWLMKRYPEIPIDPVVRKKYKDLVAEAKMLGITYLKRFHTTAILRRVIDNRRHIARIDHRPLAVLFYPKTDHNRAFESNDLIKLDRHYRVLYFEVGDVPTLQRQFEIATRAQKASIVVLAAHGTPLGRRVSLVLDGKHGLDISDLGWLKKMNNRIAPSAHIVLVSCFSGSGKGTSYDIASAIADAVPHATIHAPVKSSHSFIRLSSNGAFQGVFTHDAGNPYGGQKPALMLQRASLTSRLYHHGSPIVVNPKPGWDDPSRNMDPFSYQSYLMSIGYAVGIKRFPHFTLAAPPALTLSYDSRKNPPDRIHKAPEAQLFGALRLSIAQPSTALTDP